MANIKHAIKTQSCQTRRGTKYLRVFYDNDTTEDFTLSYFDRDLAQGEQGVESRGFEKVPEEQWAFASCDNPNCPCHPMNGGEPNKVRPMFQNKKVTLCEVCLDDWKEAESKQYDADCRRQEMPCRGN